MFTPSCIFYLLHILVQYSASGPLLYLLFLLAAIPYNDLIAVWHNLLYWLLLLQMCLYIDSLALVTQMNSAILHMSDTQVRWLCLQTPSSAVLLGNNVGCEVQSLLSFVSMWRKEYARLHNIEEDSPFGALLWWWTIWYVAQFLCSL